MKQKTLRILSEAREEIDSAFECYFERSPKAAGAFLNAVDASLAQIASYPQIHPRYTTNTRRCIVERFPHSVVFQKKDDTILVIA